MRVVLRLVAAMACFMVISAVAPLQANAHPEDELCTPDGGMDPALCRELARIDQKNAPPEKRRPDAQSGPDRVNLDRTGFATLAFYVRIGFAHILPMGTDHILFVLVLFLSSLRVRPLLFQISAFTIAHTATLGLAASGVITPLPSIIEPLIALTIAWAALENIVFEETQAWRPLLVFGFGLIHGMGFAGAFGDVIGMALAASLYFKRVLSRAGQMQLYRPVLVWPVSAMIGAVGLWWAFERVFLLG